MTVVMQTITLKPFYHGGEERIGMYYHPDEAITRILKKIPGIRWSQTKRCWHIACNRPCYDALVKHITGHAVLQTDALKIYLQQRKVLAPATAHPVKAAKAQMMLLHPLSEENLAALSACRNLMVLKGYSQHTIRNYCNELHQLLRLLGKRPVNSLEKKHIMSYLLWLLEKKGCSEAQVHTAVNAIKFYFEKLMKRDKEFYDLPRPKKPFKLPDILAGEEVMALLQKMTNLKHRTMIMTGYAAGLRVSEIVRLTIGDIDSKRMTIHIRGAKGKKDRIVPLSKKLLETLRIYYRQYRPINYLFEGQYGGAYSTRSAQSILMEAKQKAGIHKKGSIHSLRHSYATHLMEAGTDIRIIQELLGHNTIKTTMLYTHVSKKDITRIESPLDKLNW